MEKRSSTYKIGAEKKFTNILTHRETAGVLTKTVEGILRSKFEKCPQVRTVYAVLKALGVGDTEATVISATMTWLLRDGCGMVTSILFTYFKAPILDNHPKQWRLVADVLNDISMLIELLFQSPYVLCISSAFRAVVGAAGGATRTPIIMHQARRGNNFGDVAAKDGAQETLVNLVGLVLNVMLVPRITQSTLVTWCFFLTFMALHIFFNYRCVRSVCSSFLNIYRLNVMDRFHTRSESI